MGIAISCTERPGIAGNADANRRNSTLGSLGDVGQGRVVRSGCSSLSWSEIERECSPAPQATSIPRQAHIQSRHRGCLEAADVGNLELCETLQITFPFCLFVRERGRGCAKLARLRTWSTGPRLAQANRCTLGFPENGQVEQVQGRQGREV